MKNSIKWSVLALLLLTVPVTYCPQEAEVYDNSIEDRTNETAKEKELREKSIELERVRHMRGENFAYSDSDPKKSPLQSTKETFEEPTNWQKVANFFSRIFGDSGVVRDSLRQHDSSTANTKTALYDEMQSKTFLALRPDQQLEDLTEWSYREKTKFEHAKANVEKINTAALRDLKTKRQKLETTVEQTNKDTSTEITNFKNNYAELRQKFKTLPELKENPTAQDIQNTIQELQSDTSEVQRSQNPIIADLRRKLSISASRITTNTQRIKEDQQQLQTQEQEILKQNLDNHINTQTEFNDRVRKFQNEIQAILDRDEKNKLQLKYNVDTGQFEYHTKNSGDSAPLSNRSFNSEYADHHVQDLMHDYTTKQRSASVVTNRDQDDVPSQLFRPENPTDTGPRREPATTGTQQHQQIETGLPLDIHRDEAPIVRHGAPQYEYLDANGEIDMDKLPSAHERYQVIDEYLEAHPQQKTALLAITKLWRNPTPEQYKMVIDRGPHLAGLRAFINENPENIKDVIISVEHDDQDEKDLQGRLQHMNPRTEEAQAPKRTDSETPAFPVHSRETEEPIFVPHHEHKPAAQPSRYQYLDANGDIDMNKLPDTDRYRVADEYLAAHPEIKNALEAEFKRRVYNATRANYEKFINENESMIGLRTFIKTPRNLTALQVAVGNEDDDDFIKSWNEQNN